MASIGNDSNLVFDEDDDFGFGRDEEDEEVQQQAEEQPIDDDFGFGRDEQEQELEQQPGDQTTEETDIQHQQQLATVPTIQQPEEQEVAVAVSVVKKRRRFTIQEKPLCRLKYYSYVLVEDTPQPPKTPRPLSRDGCDQLQNKILS